MMAGVMVALKAEWKADVMATKKVAYLAVQLAGYWVALTARKTVEMMVGRMVS